MKIALFSDTHSFHGQINIPDADILIFAGDMTHCKTARDVSEFNSFLGGLPHKHKIVVGGNHDLTGEMLRQVWESRYGPRYYHFVYKDVLFLILSTEDPPKKDVEKELYEKMVYCRDGARSSPLGGA